MRGAMAGEGVINWAIEEHFVETRVARRGGSGRGEG